MQNPACGGRIRTPPEKRRDFADAQPAARPTDSKTRILKILKCYKFNWLIPFNFFNKLLVSFGIIWKYLTLTGTIWAQSSFRKNSDILFLNRLFWYQNHHFKAKKRGYL
jgi:hypothetical protein